VVVSDFDIEDIDSVPLETDPVLVVDANAVLASSVSLELFEPPARKQCEISEYGHRIQRCQSPARLLMELNRQGAPRSFGVCAFSNIAGAFVPV
jgi:hypothetical protein